MGGKGEEVLQAFFGGGGIANLRLRTHLPWAQITAPAQWLALLIPDLAGPCSISSISELFPHDFLMFQKLMDCDTC